MSSLHRNKRQKLDEGVDELDPAIIRQQRAAFLSSMSRAVSPPSSLRAEVNKSSPTTQSNRNQNSNPPLQNNRSASIDSTSDAATESPSPEPALSIRLLTSPFKLTKIQDLPSKDNTDTVSLHNILGNPLIKEAWVFNFCFDINWMMQHFDSDVRDMVSVKVIHGSWKNEDGNRINIVEACKRWTNVEANTAYLPDPFGTHHSKMFFLFTHDDKAEVIIHTANMLAKDWTNMTQALWRSGPLEKKKTIKKEPEVGLIGSGSRFKQDLLAYLKTYRKPVQSLYKQLQEYDFTSVRGALVASVPSKVKMTQTVSTPAEHLWGYPQLREVVTAIQKSRNQIKPFQASPHKPHLICQVSSIASLPAGWLDNLCNIALDNQNIPSDNTSIIYPTPINVAKSLDGYMAGGSIHTKAQSNTHLQQINSIHIEWALLTSANLSKQAWGTYSKPTKANKNNAESTVQISSFECGVMVWPELFTPAFDRFCENAQSEENDEVYGNGRARMVPVFGQDMPDETAIQRNSHQAEMIVGLRMPYDLPLTPYADGELPWSPQSQYTTPDSLGNTWPPSGW